MIDQIAEDLMLETIEIKIEGTKINFFNFTISGCWCICKLAEVFGLIRFDTVPRSLSVVIPHLKHLASRHDLQI